MEALGYTPRQTVILSTTRTEDAAYLFQERCRVVQLVQFLFVDGIVGGSKVPSESVKIPIYSLLEIDGIKSLLPGNPISVESAAEVK
jgi:hypothetical protein